MPDPKRGGDSTGAGEALAAEVLRPSPAHLEAIKERDQLRQELETAKARIAELEAALQRKG